MSNKWQAHPQWGYSGTCIQPAPYTYRDWHAVINGLDLMQFFWMLRKLDATLSLRLDIDYGAYLGESGWVAPWTDTTTRTARGMWGGGHEQPWQRTCPAMVGNTIDTGWDGAWQPWTTPMGSTIPSITPVYRGAQAHWSGHELLRSLPIYRLEDVGYALPPVGNLLRMSSSIVGDISWSGKVDPVYTITLHPISTDGFQPDNITIYWIDLGRCQVPVYVNRLTSWGDDFPEGVGENSLSVSVDGNTLTIQGVTSSLWPDSDEIPDRRIQHTLTITFTPTWFD
jgi:hypothetical protein